MPVAAPSIRIVVRNVNDRQLVSHIQRMSAATGRTVKEETRTVFKGMVRDAMLITPPAGAGASGLDARKRGEAAINRDLKRMGFSPVKIKGFRIITQAFGRPIKPVRVPTKENPKFNAPDVFHLARLQSRHGGKVSRGGSGQAYYVSKQNFNAMRVRLMAEIGRLASGWVKAANQLGVPVPAWIARHGGARGTAVEIKETPANISMRVVNRFPDTAVEESREMIRRIDKIKQYAVGRLKRQLPHLLQKNLRAA